jgi:hypothetical protein
MPRLAQPFPLTEHEAARPTVRRFHHQALLTMMQTFPDMRQMRQDVLLRDVRAGRELFGRRRLFQEDVDDHLTHGLRHMADLLWWTPSRLQPCDDGLFAEHTLFGLFTQKGQHGDFTVQIGDDDAGVERGHEL